MSWDWQKRLHSEAPDPAPDDSSFGGLAVEASEQEQERADPAAAGGMLTREAGKHEASPAYPGCAGEGMPPSDRGGTAGVAFTGGATGIASIRDAPGMASTRGAGGMDWHAAGAGNKGGRSLPQLLYGEEHRCAFCRGTGQMPRANRCPVCRGSGKVSLAPPVVRCAFCNGGGHKPAGSTVTCAVCRGSGFVKVRPPIQICPNCRGRGRQMGCSLYCGLCRGTGVVTVSDSHELIEHDVRSRINDRRI